MTQNDTLFELIWRITAQEEDEQVIRWEEVQNWPDGALELFQRLGLIRPAPHTHSVECPGCEENCFMPIHVLPEEHGRPARAYVVCDQKDYMGRIPIPLERLQQWQV